MKKSLGSKLKQAIAKTNEPAPPHLIVEARAGTGKTTTMIEGLKLLKGETPKITPSPQQQAIWEQIMLSKDAKTICFVAFNVSIADELKRRVPAGVDAMTMNSLGNKAVYKAFGRQEPVNWANREHLARLLDVDSRVLSKSRPGLVAAVDELVTLCKQNLIDPTRDAEEVTDDPLGQLISHYGIEIDGKDRVEVYQLVPDVLNACLEPKGTITFADQIWLPIVLNLPLFRYDLLMVDEAQDLNRCQQALAKKAGKRLILVGDPKQAIYGFAGADAESMPRLARELNEGTNTLAGDRRCIILPLTVTRRCGKAIVEEANKIVPDFEAHESNLPGIISTKYYTSQDGSVPSYHSFVQDGDMLLCRVNAQLVSQCFKFIKMNRKATIRGRDVAAGLTKTVKKMDASSIPDLVAKLVDWHNSECAKESAKRNPSENRLITIRDRFVCLLCFVDGAKSVQEVLDKIDKIFVDNPGDGILLSSVHKAKGLEAKRVFILMPKGSEMPHPMVKSKWQIEQEWNLKYVAITRAIEELIYVY